MANRMIFFGIIALFGMGGSALTHVNRVPQKQDLAGPKAAAVMAKAPNEVRNYRKGDAVIAAARRRGQETLPRFRELCHPFVRGVCSVKFPLTQNGRTEHIWLQVDKVGKDSFTGRLANKPVNGSKYRLGQQMTVAADDVEDWMLRTAGQEIYGNYTLRAMLKDMPKDEASVFRKMLRD